MLMKYCRDHTIMDMAYLDPTMATKALEMKKPEETENYIVNFFLEHQNKRYIFLPYTFKYISNYTIDRYYFSLSFCNLWLIHCNWILYRFHWIYLLIHLSTNRIYVMDSLRKPKEDLSDIANLLRR
jgi:hypothetical protein